MLFIESVQLRCTILVISSTKKCSWSYRSLYHNKQISCVVHLLSFGLDNWIQWINKYEGHSINKVNLTKELAIGSTVYVWWGFSCLRRLSTSLLLTNASETFSLQENRCVFTPWTVVLNWAHWQNPYLFPCSLFKTKITCILIWPCLIFCL